MKNYDFDSPMWDWFELSYSSYLVLPRTLLCGMPRFWQERMVSLLREMEEVYDCNKIESNYTVKLKDGKGRFKKDPLANYRHPPELPYSPTFEWPLTHEERSEKVLKEMAAMQEANRKICEIGACIHPEHRLQTIKNDST